MNTEIKQEKIICPVCGQEYLPIEIFVPYNFFGTLNFIKRNEDGKIEYFLGQEPDYCETFTCTKCNTTFITKTQISFKTELNQKLDYEHLYVTKLD